MDAIQTSFDCFIRLRSRRRSNATLRSMLRSTRAMAMERRRRLLAVGRFETEILAQPQNLELLMNLPGMWGDKVRE